MSDTKAKTSSDPDVSLDAARLYLAQAGFDDVPAAHVLAVEPEWLLKIAGVLVLRNLPRMERASVKDCAKILVDIASGGVRAGSGGESGGDAIALLREVLTGDAPLNPITPLDGSEPYDEIDDRPQGEIRI